MFIAFCFRFVLFGLYMYILHCFVYVLFIVVCIFPFPSLVCLWTYVFLYSSTPLTVDNYMFGALSSILSYTINTRVQIPKDFIKIWYMIIIIYQVYTGILKNVSISVCNTHLSKVNRSKNLYIATNLRLKNECFEMLLLYFKNLSRDS